MYRNLHSSYPQVCSPALRSIACNDGHFCSLEDRSNTIDVGCSGSMQGNCIPSQFSKPYLMYSTIDAASVALDFSKENVEDGVIDSSPSRSIGRTPVCLPFLLRDCQSTPIHVRQCITMYVHLKGSFIAKHHSTRMKPKRRIMSIIASAFP